MTELDYTCPVQYTHSFPAVLSEIGQSLIISGYQSNKVIILSAIAGELSVTTHPFDKPMGIAVSSNRIAIATRGAIREFVKCGIAPKGADSQIPSDAFYVPHKDTHTGRLDIHEMSFLEDELHFINTRFSCLCTMGDGLSFKPLWRPPTVTALTAWDTCHLNGLGVRDGLPKYATSLGISNEPFGWRAKKDSGGVLIDVESDQIIASGLSMPHSPRWHREELWFLESGKGNLCKLNAETADIQCVGSLPGFTRGLSFYKNLAFVGISRARGTSTFSGLEITRTVAERDSGIWVLDTNSGETVAAVKFGGDIDEVFSVDLLAHENPIFSPHPSDITLESFILDRETTENFRRQEQSWANPNRYFETGQQAFENGDFMAAIEALRHTLLLNPSHDAARLKLSEALDNIGAYEEARRELHPGAQLAWNPNGTRWGRVTRAIGPTATSVASNTRQ